MDENDQDKTNYNLVTTENKIWLPPSYMRYKVPVASAQKKRGINWGFADRTVFDWTILVSQVLGAVAIPFVVTMLGLYLTQQITQQQAALAQKQHNSDQAIANQQHDSDKAIALDQQRATTLQTYIDNIQDLLLNHHLLGAKPEDDIAILARARTLTALEGLDGSRKGDLIVFLYEARLIGFIDGKNKLQPPIIDLSSADLSSTDLSGATLHGIDLSSTDLSDAKLYGIDVSGAVMMFTDLSGTDLSEAHLNSADLSHASLSVADLNGAFLSNADLAHADLSGANLMLTDLSNANLSSARLTDTNLMFTNLSGANLSNAYLNGAMVGLDQLANTKSLKGATMPDGTKHD